MRLLVLVAEPNLLDLSFDYLALGYCIRAGTGKRPTEAVLTNQAE